MITLIYDTDKIYFMVYTGHPWHDIEIGKKAPKIVNMVVEIPKDSKIKYELDKKSGMLKMDRFLYSAVHYPGDYGFIPKTLWEDDDPLDILLLTSKGMFPLTICEVKVIGVLHMHDNTESDDKIIAVHQNDPRYLEWTNIDKIPKHYVKELKHFFETYKQLQNTDVKVFSFKGPQAAYATIKKSQELYKKKFAKDVF